MKWEHRTGGRRREEERGGERRREEERGGERRREEEEVEEEEEGGARKTARHVMAGTVMAGTAATCRKSNGNTQDIHQ